ncbi:uncharacterized protein [Amphiura filiformis]|uniref:uncharacterized protein n=1 Tax=Amphiura filiformis TaxID=82378 RepID=UPI003B2207E5
MAEALTAAGTIVTIRGLYLIGKDVYDRCKAIDDDFGDSKKRLMERLHTITSTLKSYEELEKAGKIKLQEEWSSDLTAVGIPANYLRQHLKKAKQYLEEFEEKRKVSKFLSKTDIEKKFKELADDLHVASTALANAVQPLMIPGVKPKHTPSPIALMSSSDLAKIKDLSRGSYGRVFLAEHRQMGQVAVKKVLSKA